VARLVLEQQMLQALVLEQLKVQELEPEQRL
jgi:hypothetical protein